MVISSFLHAFVYRLEILLKFQFQFENSFIEIFFVEHIFAAEVFFFFLDVFILVLKRKFLNFVDNLIAPFIQS